MERLQTWVGGGFVVIWRWSRYEMGWRVACGPVLSFGVCAEVVERYFDF